MFRMVGNEVVLNKYRVSFNKYEHDDKPIRVRIRNFELMSDVERYTNVLNERKVEFAVEEIDHVGNEWFEGLEFESYDEALVVFNAGEVIYLQNKLRLEELDNLRLRADIDYIAIMSEVTI